MIGDYYPLRNIRDLFFIQPEVMKAGYRPKLNGLEM